MNKCNDGEKPILLQHDLNLIRIKSLDKYQVSDGRGIPVAAASNFAFWPSLTSLSVGWRVQAGGSCFAVNKKSSDIVIV